MEGLLTLLIFGGLFYLMMRFGCGSHMKHGKQSKQQKTDHVDPVCKMTVDPQKGYGMMYKGTLYRFCSHQCMDKFEKESEKYVPNDQ